MDVIVYATADFEGAVFCTAGVKTNDTMHQNACSALIHMRTMHGCTEECLALCCTPVLSCHAATIESNAVRSRIEQKAQ